MSDVLGVILAGGQSRRMGAEKAFVELGGRPLLAHVVDRIAPQCGALAVNANGDPARFGPFDFPVLNDGDVEGYGPLAGVLAALDWGAALGVRKVLTVAVDTPFLPRNLVTRLQDSGADIALAATSDGVHGTTGLWSVDLRDDLRAALVEGTRKVTDWTGARGAEAVLFDDTQPPPFFNINRPEDLVQAEVYLKAAG